MERVLSAAGKLFLSGEYAVLWGGTARVAAVAPRTMALVRRRSDREVHIVLEEGRLVGRTTPLGVNWDGEVPPGFLFAARALDLVMRAHGRETVGFDLAVGPTPAGPEGRKLGMGGSARAALLAAEAGRFILDERFDSLKLALAAHAIAQRGAGSGADVAASFAGGIIRYRRYNVEPLVKAASAVEVTAALGSSPPVDLWRLPNTSIQLAYAYTGASASTPELVAQIDARISAVARQRFLGRSEELGQALEDGLLRNDFGAVRGACVDLEALLAGLGPIETDAMRRVLSIADSYGATGKLSGAGGGDGCILFAPDAESRRALVEGLEARGFFAMELLVEAGLRGEARADETLRGWLA